MTIRKLCYLGDPILRRECRKVEAITPEIKQIAEDLLDTVEVHNGAGLAAPQIGYDYQIFVCALSDEIDEKGYPFDVPPKIFINPVITIKNKKKKIFQEGCLSIPGVYERVPRASVIDVEAMDINGKMFKEENLTNWRSANIQHETDHVHGILYIDHLSKEQMESIEGHLAAVQMKFQSQTLGPQNPFSS